MMWLGWPKADALVRRHGRNYKRVISERIMGVIEDFIVIF